MDQFKTDTAKGDQALDPDQLNLLRMIESRIVEIVQIEKDVKKKFPKLYSQRLPRFMRRRAGSHNPLRIPRWLRSGKMTARDRKKLYNCRRRLRFSKHKRILQRHARHNYSNPNKSLLHKWFAKRFKMETGPRTDIKFMPLHNCTKNFRNLYRQTKYGCAYISMAHLKAFRINSPNDTKTVDVLNEMTQSISGFTFAARALESSNYEVVVHLYEKKPTVMEKHSKKAQQRHICPAIVHNNKVYWTLWVDRGVASKVDKLLSTAGLPYCEVALRDAVRLRLVGPEAYAEAARIATDSKKHEEAVQDVELRLIRSFKLETTIGRHVEEKNALFTYYNTEPASVDIVFRNRREGRMLWHRLIRNKAHLVGGKRDVDELLLETYAKTFQLKPDCD